MKNEMVSENLIRAESGFVHFQPEPVRVHRSGRPAVISAVHGQWRISDAVRVSELGHLTKNSLSLRQPEKLNADSNEHNHARGLFYHGGKELTNDALFRQSARRFPET